MLSCFSRVQLFLTLCPMGFPRQEHWHLPGWRTSGLRAGSVPLPRGLWYRCRASPSPRELLGPWASPAGQALPDLLGSDHDLGEDVLSGWPPLPPAGPPVRSGAPEEALAPHPQRGPAGGWALGRQESEEPLAGRGEVGAGIRDSQVQGARPDALVSCGSGEPGLGVRAVVQGGRSSGQA